MQSQSPYPQSPQASPRVRSPLDELKPELKTQGDDNVTKRLAETAQSAIDRVAEKATPAVEKIAESAKSVVDATVSKLGTVRGDPLDSVRTYVRDRPFTALAAAALLGAVFSSMLSSHSHRE